MRRFLERFAPDGLNECLARFQVACGLIDAQPVRRFFLDDEKTAIVFDDVEVALKIYEQL